ncbi:hypothetical protein, partial [Bacillus thuringiensis]|uniref:hypothetical protein n=1 Tax=Bacillus thuringiensis TaxID=1428 RepID=UPI0038886C3D
YKDIVTVNDYFDIMYTLTYGHNIEDVLTVLKKQSEENLTDESIPVDYIRKARKLVNNGLIPEMLSPAVTTIQENEYFELANLNVYEYKQYVLSEVQQMLWTAQIIVNGPRERDENGEVITNIDLDFKGNRWVEYT